MEINRRLQMHLRRAPSLLALRTFEVAARRLSFPGCGQPPCTALEANFGQPLFRRLYLRVELTIAGKRLATELAVGF
jgi:hypothetical protein